MNLLIDNWIPVRPRNGGKVQIINLQSLYCSRDQWRLSLPRDDMELAALALLVCIGQIIDPAKDDVEFRHRIMNPLTEDEFQQLIAPWIDMFYLNHAEHPFMQTKGVKANDVTPMEKLLAGVSGATNCAPLGLENVLAVDRKAICVIPVFLRKNLPLQLMDYGPIRIPLVW